ncbi:MAG TPA: aspartate aminotransferase family protein [Candidatus Binatia bacterium]|nr:aspartate aminotransferase family protein [Candidatus Binatia bacterium]
MRTVVANSISVSHPHTAAHLHCPPLVAALAAEVVISALNQSMDSFDQAPVATIVEQKMIRWLCADAVLPATAGGTFTTGGSLSNYMGLLLARDTFLRKRRNWSTLKSGLPAEARQLRILCSEVAHFTVEKSAIQLGLGTDSVVRVPVDDHFRMDPAALRGALATMQSQNLHPMAVVATAGTTDFGSIDPLPELAAAARSANLWLHVDAAYGGALLFSSDHRAKLAGIEQADSLSIDFHKLLWQPIPCSVFLVRESQHFDSIKLHADYLNPELDEDAGVPNLVTTSLLTTRRFDALKLWISLQSLGRTQLAAMIDRTIALAAYSAAIVRETPSLELMCEPQLSTVLFRYTPRQAAVDADQINMSIRRRLFATGSAVVGHTRVRGQQCLKFTCMNPATSDNQMKELIGMVQSQGQELERQ